MLELFSLAQIDQMSWATIVLICFIALTTAAIHGATGVAGGFLLTSALALVIGVKPIVPVVSVALLISHSTRALLNSGAFDRKVFLSVTLPALPCILVFALLYGRMSAPVIAVFLGVVILASIPLRYWAASRQIKVSKAQLGAAGAVYGTLSGASIGGGMLLVPFLLGYGLRKEAFVATLAVIALVTNIVRVGVYGTTDLLSGGWFLLGILVGLMTIPGNWFGRSVLRRISNKRHGVFVDILSLLGGLNFFWLAWQG